MKSKNPLKLYLDFDNTLVQTDHRLLQHFNQKYGFNYSLKDIYKYNMQDLYPELTSQDLRDYCGTEHFFNGLKVHKNCVKTLIKYDKYIQYYIVTASSPKRSVLIQKYLDDNFGDAVSFDGLYLFNPISNNKSSINIDGIMIDDMIDVLRDTNSKFKLLFRGGFDREYNQVLPNDSVYVVNSWEEIDDILHFVVINWR